MIRLDLTLMSGASDGTRLHYDPPGSPGGWTVRIGRKPDNDVSLHHDRYVSRYHARLRWDGTTWWLEDLASRNGTFLEAPTLEADPPRVRRPTPIRPGELFCIGRTWMRIDQDG
jgi:pSer/pThr/pTyr-binding forkhead associated (FHA) protein